MPQATMEVLGEELRALINEAESKGLSKNEIEYCLGVKQPKPNTRLVFKMLIICFGMNGRVGGWLESAFWMTKQSGGGQRYCWGNLL